MIVIRKSKSKNGDSLNSWKSFTDLMSGTLIIFIMISVITLYLYAKAEDDRRKNQEILDIRDVINEEIVSSLKEQGIEVAINEESGNIIIPNNALVFEENESFLSNRSKNFLDVFFEPYIAVLMDSEYRQYIGHIIVEGHTNARGPNGDFDDSVENYLYNLDLSQSRASEVTSYLLSQAQKYEVVVSEGDLRKYLTANGRSFSNLIYVDGIQDLDASRRVEFGFTLNQEAIKNKILGNEDE